MNASGDNGGNNGLVIGLIMGGAIGAALAIAFAPRLRSELRQRLTESADDLRHAASDRYKEVSTRVADVVDGVTARGQAVRNDVADAVGRGAREVEQFANAAKTGPGPRR